MDFFGAIWYIICILSVYGSKGAINMEKKCVLYSPTGRKSCRGGLMSKTTKCLALKELLFVQIERVITAFGVTHFHQRHEARRRNLRCGRWCLN